ncbi:MAG: hypothetical protein WCD89_10530 [Anaerocolumna sp.]
MSKKKQLIEIFADAIAVNNDYIAVAVESVGNEENEVIINPSCNFENKLEYYRKAYDENLVLKTFSGIRIVGAYSFDEDCEWNIILEMLNEPM